MMIKIRIFILGAILILLFVSIPVPGAASQTDYHIYLPMIQIPGEAVSDIKNRKESLDFYKSNYVTSTIAKIDWTGSHTSCDPGTTSRDFQQAVLTRINYFRAMAGVPDEIVFSEESNLKAQAAALLMSVNDDLDHNPPESWTCYSTLADEGAGSSNLYLGINGWEAITGYMRDPGIYNDAVGHRRWILYPQTQFMGSGDIPATESYAASNALVVFDDYIWAPRPDTRDDFVAWPPPGYVPYPVVFARWSFSYPGADFSQTTVSMFIEGEGVAITQAPIHNGYGENTVVWQLAGMDSVDNWPRPAKDTRYQIIIEDVIISGLPQDFTYEVIVFDPNS